MCLVSNGLTSCPFRSGAPWTSPGLSQIAHSVDVDGIIALCRIGHASGVAARIDELERHQPDAASAIATLRELLRDFRLREIIDYLEALRDDEW